MNDYLIMGMCSAGIELLVAISLFQKITLTIVLTNSDFVWLDFDQSKKGGCKKWPVPNLSTLSY